jgi:hypothetical protein
VVCEGIKIFGFCEGLVTTRVDLLGSPRDCLRCIEELRKKKEQKEQKLK